MGSSLWSILVVSNNFYFGHIAAISIKLPLAPSDSPAESGRQLD